MSDLIAGLNAERDYTVTDADSASRWGSGMVNVLSTPALVGLMESTAVEAIRGQLPDGQTTVGGRIEHSSPRGNTDWDECTRQGGIDPRRRSQARLLRSKPGMRSN